MGLEAVAETVPAVALGPGAKDERRAVTNHVSHVSLPLVSCPLLACPLWVDQDRRCLREAVLGAPAHGPAQDGAPVESPLVAQVGQDLGAEILAEVREGLVGPRAHERDGLDIDVERVGEHGRRRMTGPVAVVAPGEVALLGRGQHAQHFGLLALRGTARRHFDEHSARAPLV